MSQTTRLAHSLFLAALILGVAGDILLRPTPWGVNRLLWVAVLALGLIAETLWNNVRLTGSGRWLIGLALIFGAMFALRDSIMLNATNRLADLIFSALIAYQLMQGRVCVVTLTEYTL